MTEPITRRKALTALGTVSLGALLAACNGNDDVSSADVPTGGGSTATVEPQTSSGSLASLFDDAASCTLAPEESEGPYYFDVDSIRSDIREDRSGTTLRVAVRVQDAEACTPIENAVVDIWHCDAGGLYSGFEAASFGVGNQTDEETYLRGAQVTNSEGIVQFVTVYPGWYRGRTVHIHAKVHLDSSTLLTTQFYFDEAVTDAVYALDPHSEHTGRDTFNDGDGIFDSGTVLTLSKDGEGYLGVISLGVAA